MDKTLKKPLNSPEENQIALDKTRQFILDQVAKRGRDCSLKTLSLAVGKNPAYIHQFIYRGSPRQLPEDIRHKLADLLGVSEYSLREGSPSSRNTTAPIQYLDHPSQSAFDDGPWFVPQSFLERTLASINSTPNPKSMMHYIKLAIVGDSTPDLKISDGDVIMLGTNDRSPHIAGFFALDAGDHIRVRHLEQVSPKDSRIMISGNKGYITAPDDNDILGRVVFHAHLFNHHLPTPAFEARS